MAAKMSTMTQLHSALAAMLLKMLEEGVPVGTDDSGEVIFRAPSAAELGVAVAFLKNNNITASIDDNDELKALAEQLRSKSRDKGRIVPVFEEPAAWQ